MQNKRYTPYTQHNIFSYTNTMPEYVIQLPLEMLSFIKEPVSILIELVNSLNFFDVFLFKNYTQRILNNRKI